MGLVTFCERCKGEIRPYDEYGEQPCRKCLQADNARLREMLELAARGRIGFRGYLVDGKSFYGPLVCGNPLCAVNKTYKTPIEALEVAYEEWKR